MSLDDNLDELQNKALEMGRYYYKGFGNTINGILANAEMHFRKPQRESYINSSYEWLKEIEEFYTKIPFNDLHGKEEFYPLFIIKQLLPKFKESMYEVFQHSNKYGLHNLRTNAKTIVTVGRIYWDNFEKILNKIREYPIAHDFMIKIIDYQNNVWYL